MYDVDVTPEGLRSVNRLPSKVRDAAREFAYGPLSRDPQRLGKPLMDELEGLLSARLGDYRVIYEILEEESVVLIHRIGHRRDVYRPR